MKIHSLIMIDLDRHFETTVLASVKDTGQPIGEVLETLYRTGQPVFIDLVGRSYDPEEAEAVYTALETGDSDDLEDSPSYELQTIEIDIPD